MAEILKDVFHLRMNVNQDPTARTGAFNVGTAAAGVAIVSSTNATPIVVTVGSTASLGAASDVVTVAIFEHATNTQANGVWQATIIDGTTFSLGGSRGNGVGGATGKVYKSPVRWVPVFEDGFQVGEKVSRVDVPTQHKDRGPRYAVPGDRNREAQQIRTPLYPELAGFLLNLPVTLQSGGNIPQYFAAEEYWTGALATGSSNFLASGSGADVQTGRGCLGMICNGWTLNFDRQQTAALELTLDVFLNQETSITAAAPSIPNTGTSAGYLGWPTQDPYLNTNVYIDLEFADYNGAFAGWTGDRADVRQLQIQYSQNLELDISKPSSTVSLDNAWSKVYAGTPSVNVTATLIMASTDYLRLTRLSSLRKARLRMMGVGNRPSGSATSSTNFTTATTTLVVSSGTQFHTGDVLLVEKVSAGKQAVVTVTAVDVAHTSLTVTAPDVTLDGSTGDALVVRNTAWEIKVPSMDVSDRSPPTAGGAVKVLSLAAAARLTPTTTTLATITAYNDDNAQYPTT